MIFYFCKFFISHSNSLLIEFVPVNSCSKPLENESSNINIFCNQIQKIEIRPHVYPLFDLWLVILYKLENPISKKIDGMRI